jgi:hypothetical protein
MHRDKATVESELRLLRAVRAYLKDEGVVPDSRQVDARLDELLEFGSSLGESPIHSRTADSERLGDC